MRSNPGRTSAICPCMMSSHDPRAMGTERRERLEHRVVVALLAGERLADHVVRVTVADGHGVAPPQRRPRDEVRGPGADAGQRLELRHRDRRIDVAESLERSPSSRSFTQRAAAT